MHLPRQNPIHEAVIETARAVVRLGRELRLARIREGLTQAELAARLGWSQARISLIERGRYAHATPADLGRHAAAVGLRLYLRAFPGRRRLLDAPQLALLSRLRELIHAAWQWELEVPMPRPGDLRAGDCRLVLGACSILVEAITRLADLQAQLRDARAKAAELGVNRLILLVADTRANREAYREAGAAVGAAFPTTGRAILRALREGRDPEADGIVFLKVGAGTGH
jgi:transcriptional regulator with XRE-family HTH domain